MLAVKLKAIKLLSNRTANLHESVNKRTKTERFSQPHKIHREKWRRKVKRENG